MKKETFVTIMNELDTFFNELVEKMEAIGFNFDNNPIVERFDLICDAIDKEMDPDQLANDDKYCWDAGSFIYEWLFGESEFNEVCKTAEDLYIYIENKYIEVAKEKVMVKA